MSLDFEKLLTLGVEGIIAEIEAKPDCTMNRFYSGALLELRALLTLVGRYSERARALGRNDIADVHLSMM